MGRRRRGFVTAEGERDMGSGLCASQCGLHVRIGRRCFATDRLATTPLQGAGLKSDCCRDTASKVRCPGPSSIGTDDLIICGHCSEEDDGKAACATMRFEQFAALSAGPVSGWEAFGLHGPAQPGVPLQQKAQASPYVKDWHLPALCPPDEQV